MEFETEEQQLEAFKKWWKENGNAIIAGILAAIIGVGGYKFWTTQQQQKAESASAAYSAFIDLTAGPQRNVEKALSSGEQVVADYADTEYSILASLVMAKLSVEEREYETAEKHLRWAVDNGKREETVLISRLRLARVLVQLEKYDDALAVLEVQVPEAFNAQFLELKGDAYYHKGDRDAARQLYQQAMAIISGKPGNQSVLQIKIDNLAEGL